MKVRSFKLSDKFLDEYKEKDVPWGPLGYVVYKRTYARRLDENNPEAGTEEWWQTCRRVIEGMFDMQKQHCKEIGVPWNDAKAQRTAKVAYDRLFNLKWTPPGRGIWMMGTPYVTERTGAALMNCAFRSTERLSERGGYIFSWMMDALMVGVGVGFDTKGAGTIKILKPGSIYPTPELFNEPQNEYYRAQDGWVCIIADSREGWVESVRVLLNAFFFGYELPAFVYSKIRPEGTPIKGFGGTASGPGPLRELHESLANLYLERVGQPITTADIVDTENLIGRCVVAGNVRRSAALAIGQHDDQQFISLKDPTQVHEWEIELHSLENPKPIRHHFSGSDGQCAYCGESQSRRSYGAVCPSAPPEDHQESITRLQDKIANHPLRHHRWGSNNSIEAVVGMSYAEQAELTIKNGEPGYIWLDNARSHGRMKDGPKDNDLKVAGMNPCVEQQLEDSELCCLVETYPWLHDSYEDYLVTLKIAYLYAKTVTLAKTQWPETNAIMLRNRRIGLSMSGFQQAVAQRGYTTMYEWCDNAYQYVQELDAIYSDWLCVPRSKRKTSIKPSGTVSKLNGSDPGIHYPEAEYYIQRIRFSADSDMLPALEAAGYPIEDCIYSPRTKVVEFPVHKPLFTRGKADVSMWEQLEIAAQMQYYWADNSVSVTVTFQPHEANSIQHALQLYEKRLKAVSFLQYKETGYAQAPLEPITEQEYERRVSVVTPLQRIDTKAQGVGERFCTNESCEISL